MGFPSESKKGKRDGRTCLLRRFGSTALSLTSARLRNSPSQRLHQTGLKQSSPSAWSGPRLLGKRGARASAQFATQVRSSLWNVLWGSV